jgi:hypothetical protein
VAVLLILIPALALALWGAARLRVVSLAER